MTQEYTLGDKSPSSQMQGTHDGNGAIISIPCGIGKQPRRSVETIKAPEDGAGVKRRTFGSFYVSIPTGCFNKQSVAVLSRGGFWYAR